jgi:hypothetical protein
VLPHHPRMEQLLQPVELEGILEDDARHRCPVDPLGADDIRSETLGDLAQHVGVLSQQPVNDVVARPRGRTVTRERFERGALAGADPARDGDR